MHLWNRILAMLENILVCIAAGVERGHLRVSNLVSKLSSKCEKDFEPIKKSRITINLVNEVKSVKIFHSLIPACKKMEFE